MKPIIYFFLKYLCRAGFPFYFSKIEINGRSDIPANAPIIFAPNHHNAFLDAILIVTFTDKPIYFLTRADVFVKPYLWILDAMKMIPVYRIRDGLNQVSKNESTFRKCTELMAKDQRILIFPEANQADTHYLRPLKKGTARLALQAQESLENNLYIVPVGINYFHTIFPRRKVIINFGNPIPIADFMPRYTVEKVKTTEDLRLKMSAEIKNCLLIPEKDENYSLKKKALHPGNENLNFQVLKKMISEMSFDNFTFRPNLRYISYFLALANWLPLLIIRYINTKLVKDPQFVGPLKFVVGTFLFPIWWLLVLIIIWKTVSPAIALLSIAGMIGSLFLGQYFYNLSSDK